MQLRTFGKIIFFSTTKIMGSNPTKHQTFRQAVCRNMPGNLIVNHKNKIGTMKRGGMK